MNNILNETALQIIDKVPNRNLTCKLSGTPLPSVCKRRKLSQLRGRENITRRRDRDECLRSRRAKSYCVKLRRPYGVRGGAPGKEEIDPERLRELLEYYRVSDHIPSYLWRLVTQRYYKSEKVSNNQITKLITFFEENKDLFLGKKESKSYSSAQGPNIGNMKEGAQFAVNVCSGIILNVAKSLKESQINTNEVVNLTKKVCAEIASSAFEKDLPPAEMSQIKSSASSPPFQGSDKDTSKTVRVEPSKTTSAEENKANHLLLLPHFKTMIMAKILEKITRKPPTNPRVQIKASHYLMKATVLRRKLAKNIPRKLRN